jgi:SAM-dependent methyltransferase
MPSTSTPVLLGGPVDTLARQPSRQPSVAAWDSLPYGVIATELMTSHRSRHAAVWDAEYRAGRYLGEPPVGFVEDILASARRCGLTGGLYIGCGNGRNYLPLVERGLDLVALDISAVAIDRLGSVAPDRAARLVVGDISALSEDERFDIVIGIQVFQHGTRRQATETIREAQRRVNPGGIFCLRVNATPTELVYSHSVTETGSDGSYTVRYEAGPKAGLDIHFFARDSLDSLFSDFSPLLPLRLDVTQRRSPDTGSWSQWEGIWQLERAVP